LVAARESSQIAKTLSTAIFNFMKQSLKPRGVMLATGHDHVALDLCATRIYNPREFANRYIWSMRPTIGLCIHVEFASGRAQPRPEKGQLTKSELLLFHDVPHQR
jgi:hypothetical protein